jgi:single-strand DNA-binding protein
MADLNKVFLMGALTHDPELRYTTNGTAVADLRLATTRAWSGKDGERREDKLFIDVTVWNRQAENCCQYLKKGRTIHVEGYLKLESWDTPTGEKRSKIKVEAERVQFLDRRDEPGGGPVPTPADDEYGAGSAPPRRSSAPSSSAGPARGGYQGRNTQAQPLRTPSPAPPSSADDEGEEEDIPF